MHSSLQKKLWIFEQSFSGPEAKVRPNCGKSKKQLTNGKGAAMICLTKNERKTGMNFGSRSMMMEMCMGMRCMRMSVRAALSDPLSI